MKIHLKTSAGLANRLRAIDSAIILSNYLSASLSIFWPIDTNLGAHFTDLFQAPKEFTLNPKKEFREASFLNRLLSSNFQKNAKFTSSSLLSTPKTYVNNTGQCLLSALPIESIPSNCRMLTIETEHAFCYPEDYSYLRPIPEIQRQIDETVSLFSPETIGLHIRRGDHRQSIELSPTEVFVSEINRHIGQYPSCKFFLSTDDAKLREVLMKSFADSIITRKTLTARQNVNGMQSAVVDLWSLSACKDIWGSKGSSFSELAYHINAQNLYYITTDGLTLAATKQKPRNSC